ncbi:MAG: dephospho-CoA kinase [Parasporobacterium sp.]|nr:dephospho-CoA kinase [Parasporobacterium sp.]
MFIGITGGVGTGKSTILNYMEEAYGAHIIKADDLSKTMSLKGGRAYKAIVDTFGEAILTDGPDSEIDRKILGEITFNNDEALAKLNNIIHPLVREEIIALRDKYYEANPQAIIVLEAALLIECGYKELLDDLWAVLVDKDTRLERLKAQRGYTEEKLDSIMDNQLSDEEFVSGSDFIIDNSLSEAYTKRQIDYRMKLLLFGLTD